MIEHDAEQESLANEIAELEQRLQAAKARLATSITAASKAPLSDHTSAGNSYQNPTSSSPPTNNYRSTPTHSSPSSRLCPPTRLLRLQQWPRILPSAPPAITALRQPGPRLPPLLGPLTINAMHDIAAIRAS